MKKIVTQNKISDARMETFGIATLLVILVHAKSYNWETYSTVLYKICELGSIGVDIFLFLSGMGLYYSMENCDSVKEFYKRRIVRIIPAYLMIAGLLYGVLFIFNTISLTDYLLHISTLYMWIKGPSVTWYISFLVLLYVLYPLFYRVLISQNGKRNTMILIGIIVIAEIGLFVFAREFYLYYEYALARIPIFMLGVISGKREFDGNGYSIWSVLIYGISFIAIRIILILSGVSQTDLYQVGIRISYIFGTLFIVELIPLLKRVVSDNFIMRILKNLGVISLEIYLGHSLYSQIFQGTNLYQKFNTPFSYLVFVVVPSIVVIWVIENIWKNRHTHIA